MAKVTTQMLWSVSRAQAVHICIWPVFCFFPGKSADVLQERTKNERTKSSACIMQQERFCGLSHSSIPDAVVPSGSCISCSVITVDGPSRSEVEVLRRSRFPLASLCGQTFVRKPRSRHLISKSGKMRWRFTNDGQLLLWFLKVIIKIRQPQFCSCLWLPLE